MSLALGGPGLPCSIARMRRLAADELSGEARALAEEHLADCARCKASAREIESERRELEEALPFEAFAGGVAERLARTGLPGRRRRWRALPLALAATLAAGVAVPLVLRLSTPEPPVRAKGGPSAVVFAQAGSQVRALEPGEPVPPGARLRVALAPAGRSQAAVVLVDADGAALLYAGPAPSGPLPEAFEWTGADRGTLVVILSDASLDGRALAARLEREGAAARVPTGAEVIRLPLTRGAR